MKKLALLLSSLLVVGAVAQAKEVVASPAPVVEQTKEVVVAPVVIIEEAAPAVFKPYGTIKQELEYFGNLEGQSDKDYLRFRPIEGNIQLTEKVSADFRTRYKIGLHNGDDKTTSTDFRTRWYYDHGQLGDSKVDMKSRLRFEKTTKFQSGLNMDPQTGIAYGLGLDYLVEYNLGFNFAKYFPKSANFAVDNFSITPSYSYMFADGSGEYANTLGIDLFSFYTLPWGFSAEFNVYAFQLWASNERALSNNSSTDSFFTTAVEAYIYYDYKLMESADGRTALNFKFEGGFDPYAWSSEKIYDIDTDAAGHITRTGDSADYTLYAMPELKVTHKVTPTTTLYASVKGWYGNEITRASDAQDWKWQPRAVAGWSTKF